MHAVRRPFPALFLGQWLPVLAYLGVIFTLSAQPNLHPPLHFENSDKWMHLLEYGGLTWLLARAIRATFGWPGLTRSVLVTFVLVVGIGATDEWFQSHVPGRESSVFDLLADSSGGVMALMLHSLTARLDA